MTERRKPYSMLFDVSEYIKVTRAMFDKVAGKNKPRHHETNLDQIRSTHLLYEAKADREQATTPTERLKALTKRTKGVVLQNPHRDRTRTE